MSMPRWQKDVGKTFRIQRRFVDDGFILTVADWSRRHRDMIKVSPRSLHTVVQNMAWMLFIFGLSEYFDKSIHYIKYFERWLISAAVTVWLRAFGLVTIGDVIIISGQIPNLKKSWLE